MDPVNPQNGFDVIGTFIMGCFYGAILYIIINVIIRGSILLLEILL